MVIMNYTAECIWVVRHGHVTDHISATAASDFG